MIRKYRAEDKEKVLELLRLNTPRFFAPAEEDELSSYLEKDADNYFVVEENGDIIGAGGYNLSPKLILAGSPGTSSIPGHREKV